MNLILLLLSLTSLLVLARLGVFRSEGLAAAPQRPNTLNFMYVFGIFAVFIIGNILGEMLVPPPAAKSAIWASWTIIASDTTGKILGIAAIIYVARRTFVGGLNTLGWNWRRAPSGVWRGLLAYVLLLPLLVMVDDLAIQLIHALHFIPQPVHPLIKEMASHPPLFHDLALIFLACVSAPIGEELFFRGILQSYLVSFFWRREFNTPGSHSAAEIPPWPALDQSGEPHGHTGPPTRQIPQNTADDAGLDRIAALQQFSATLPAPPSVLNELALPALPPVCPRHRWAGILITAVIFAAVHMAMARGAVDWFPVLFLLGIGLGYIYERTGNIWANMTLHATFNSVSVLYITFFGLPKPGHA